MRRLKGALLLSGIPLLGLVSCETGNPEEARAMLLLKNDCTACHGTLMEGGTAPSLRAVTLEGKSTEELVRVILDGLPLRNMPNYADRLGPEEAASLVRILRNETWKR